MRTERFFITVATVFTNVANPTLVGDRSIVTINMDTKLHKNQYSAHAFEALGITFFKVPHQF
jgi:hypothetical protein